MQILNLSRSAMLVYEIVLKCVLRILEAILSFWNKMSQIFFLNKCFEPLLNNLVIFEIPDYFLLLEYDQNQGFNGQGYSNKLRLA